MKKTTLATLSLGLVATIALSGCSTRAQSDEIILYYKDGVGDNKEFVECIAPSTDGKYPIDDVTYSLPTNLRSWTIAEDGSGDSTEPFIVGTKRDESGAGPEVKIYATLEFVLNTNCDGGKDSPIVNFWKTIGKKSDAHTPEGWRKMLLNTIVQAEKSAFSVLSTQYVADDLVYTNNNARAELIAKVAPLIKTELSRKTGGRSDFFCSPAFDRNTNDCGDFYLSITDVKYVNVGIQEARDNVRAAAERAKAELIEAQSKVDVARKTAEATKLNSDYLELQKLEYELKLEQERTKQAEKCAASPNCTLVVGGSGNIITGTK